MKKLLFWFFVSFLWALPVSAQLVQTPNLGLYLIPFGYQNWNTPVNDNTTTLDTKVVTLNLNCANGQAPIWSAGKFSICGTPGVDSTANVNWTGTFTINAKDVCLEDGTNCPSAGAESDPVIKALTGFVSGTGSAVNGRTFQNGTGITWTNPTGVAGNPSAAVTAAVVMTDRSSTWTTGDVNLRNAAAFTIPNATGAAPTTPGTCAFDLTSQTYKCGLTNGSTITLATTGLLGSYQPLHVNLTALSGLTGVSAGIPIFGGAGAMSISQLVLCTNTGTNALHVTSLGPPVVFSCDANASGLAGATNNYGLFATGATTFASSDALQLSGSNVWAKNGLEVGDVSTNFLRPDTTAVTGEKVWTVMNFSGTIRPSTGAFVSGNIVKSDANGLLVDGGAAGSGDVTLNGVQDLTNKTIKDAAAGGTGNVLTLPIAPYWPSGSLILPSTSTCTLGAVAAINSGPSIDAVTCTDVGTSIFEGNIVLKQAVATVTFTLTVSDVDSSSQHFAGGFQTQCRSGAAIDNTWGTSQPVDITMVTANLPYNGTTAAVTANGTCSAGAILFWRFTMDAGTNTDDGDARVLGVLLKQAS